MHSVLSAIIRDDRLDLIQKDLPSVQYKMTWDRLAMYVDRNA